MAKYYYNGVLLPEIPADVLSNYSYYYIRTNSDGIYDLIASKYPWYLNSRLYTTNSTYLWYKATLDVESWSYHTSYTDNGGFSLSTGLAWSNHDIPNGSATSTDIYFYGSDPVLEGEQEPDSPSRTSGYLLRSGTTIYTITDGTLSTLDTIDLTAETFQTYGVDDLPDGSLLVGLTDPEVLYWHDSTDDLPTLTAAVTGTPPVPQVVVSDACDMSDPSILGIESVTVVASADVLFALSFDDGATWKASDGTQWVTLEQENSGMTAETFQNISLEMWAEVVTSTAYRLRFVLMSAASYVTSVVINYLN